MIGDFNGITVEFDGEWSNWLGAGGGGAVGLNVGDVGSDLDKRSFESEYREKETRLSLYEVEDEGI